MLNTITPACLLLIGLFAIHRFKIPLARIITFGLAALVISVFAFSPEAWADTSSSPDTTIFDNTSTRICIFYSYAIKAIAAIGGISLLFQAGFAFFGKLRWQWLLYTILGMIIAGGVSAVLSHFGIGNNGASCTSTSSTSSGAT